MTMRNNFQKYFIAAVVSGLMFGVNPAVAGTFCVTGTAIPPQCFYDDVSACVGASAPPNTFCSVNPAAELTYYGTSRYCTVQSDRLAQCMYSDFVECNAAPGPVPAICVDRQGMSSDVNPFRYERRVEN